MMRNFFGRVFIFLLLVHVTGIPYVMHYCGSTGALSLEACTVCAIEEPVAETSSCCEEEELPEITAKVQIGNTEDDCCSERVIADHSGLDALSFTHQVTIPELSGSLMPPSDTIMATAISAANIIYLAHPPGCDKSSIPIVNASLRI